MFQPLPIGIENFEDFYTEDYYYADKTLLVKELWDKKAKVNLFTRPRRFGKTLALNMLKYYFEDAYDFRGNKKDYRHLFEGKQILDVGERYTRHMGQYPVISLTLKSGKQATFESCMSLLRTTLANEFDRHRYILKDDILRKKDKKRYEQYMDEELPYEDYKKSLQFLSQCLEKWSGKKVIILIDEYDVPLEGSYVYGFYDKMVDFIRELFGATLKTNDSLYFAVITGCLRISKESIFTGLNNIRIHSIMGHDYGEYFGFTEAEIKQMCKDYRLEGKYEELKDWYNGYLFGDVNVYNPWSTIQYIYDHKVKYDAFPKAYWANTSSNSIVRDLIYHASEETKEKIEHLIAGGTIEVPLQEDITYDEVYKSENNLWNFMFFTGYFKKMGERFVGSEDRSYVSLKLANREVRYIFREKVSSWFLETTKETDRSLLYHAVLNADADLMTRELRTLLKKTISYLDAQESFYHGFLAGVLTGIPNYMVKSNREGGTGRSDLFIKPIDRTKTAYVLELKVASSIPALADMTQKALEQIDDRGYEQELYDDGYLKVVKYGIAFFKKNCEVAMG